MGGGVCVRACVCERASVCVSVSASVSVSVCLCVCVRVAIRGAGPILQGQSYPKEHEMSIRGHLSYLKPPV